MIFLRNNFVPTVAKVILGLPIYLALWVPAFAGEEWQPISAEELKMTSEPKAPGVPAIYLYRQVDRDDSTARETTYERIKILTEEGRKYADVEIPFLKNRDNIKGIKARTVQPDGSIVELEGKAYEKTIVKAKGVKILAKTFTMPDVKVGSIIEYRYTNDRDSDYIYDSHWILSSQLFTKLARFSLKFSGALDLQCSWPNGLPAGTQPPNQDHAMVHLETRDVPAFEAEDYMPPEGELKYRVDFVYQPLFSPKDQTKYWESYGKSRYLYNERFVNKRKAMEEALATIVQPADESQTKLQKIYARVQQLQNFSYEREKTEQEAKRDKRRDLSSVEDVRKQGGGTASQINYLFIALVRAAGMEAFFVDVSTRDSYFFKPGSMNSRQLNNNVVLVRLAGRDLYFDPGSRHMPFGLLPWHETNVKGLQCAKEGGPWIQTPGSDSSVTKVERKADLRLGEDGAIEGKLTVTYSGLAAVQIRSDGDDQDDTAREKILEDEVREVAPPVTEVKLANRPEWSGSAPTFIAEFSIKSQGWASSAGRRLLLPIGIFSGGEKHLFEHATRTHPVYFHYCFTKLDDVTITLPQGWKATDLPVPVNQDQNVVAYSSAAEQGHGAVHLWRTLKMEVLAVGVPRYPALRSFFQLVRSGDEQQIVLQPAT